MIIPLQKDEALLNDIRNASTDEDQINLWWLGQSGFLVKWNGIHLLLDPYLSDSLTRKYAATDKPHIRMTEQVIDPARLDFIDLVTSSHNHTDHLDAETLQPLMQVNSDMVLIIPEANRDFVATRLQIDPAIPIGLNDGQHIRIKGCTIHAVPAAHETIERDGEGRCRFLGYIVRIGPWTIYHSGDTMEYDGLAANLQAFEIDIALLPINGRAPERRVAGNLNAQDAVRLAGEAGIRTVIPCHYDMFTFNTADPGMFVKAAEAAGQNHAVLQSGERFSQIH